MKAFSGILTVLAVAGFGFACGALALALIPAPQDPFVAPQRAPAQQVTVVIPDDVPTAWPAVFGTVPEIAPEPEPEPEIIAEEPPQENTTYWLTGLVAGRGASSWAMISENDRGVVVRVGDTLIGGETVTEIDARGVVIERDGIKELISLQKSDLDGLITRDGATDGTQTASVEILPQASVQVEEIDHDYITSLLQEAGQIGDDQALQTVTPGLIFDQIGLRPGDRIAAVNGKPLQSRELLADIADEDLAVSGLELEILRDSARHSVRVIFEN